MKYLLQTLILLALCPLPSCAKSNIENSKSTTTKTSDSLFSCYAKQLKLADNELLLVHIDMYRPAISITLITQHGVETLKEIEDIKPFLTDHTQTIIIVGKIKGNDRLHIIKHLSSKHKNDVEIYFLGNGLIRW